MGVAAHEALKRPWAVQGRKLRAARNLTRLSQENFAPEVGTTRRHLIRLENGEHRPSSDLLGRIAERTGESADSFGYPSDDDEEADQAMHDAFRMFVDLMGQIGEAREKKNARKRRERTEVEA